MRILLILSLVVMTFFCQPVFPKTGNNNSSKSEVEKLALKKKARFIRINKLLSEVRFDRLERLDKLMAGYLDKPDKDVLDKTDDLKAEIYQVTQDIEDNYARYIGFLEKIAFARGRPGLKKKRLKL